MADRAFIRESGNGEQDPLVSSEVLGFKPSTRGRGTNYSRPIRKVTHLFNGAAYTFGISQTSRGGWGERGDTCSCSGYLNDCGYVSHLL